MSRSKRRSTFMSLVLQEKVSHYFDLFLERAAQASLTEASPSYPGGKGPTMNTPPLSLAHFLPFHPYQHPKSIELLTGSG